MSDINEWFKKQQKGLYIEVKEVPLSNMNDWIPIMKDGGIDHIAHKEGKFHRGVFLHAWDIAKEKWTDRFLLAPIPDGDQKYYGVLLLARYKNKYLIQAKSEPGNWGEGHVQITSTIHASYTNINNPLSNIKFMDMINDPDHVEVISAQDGAQLYLKNNRVCFLELKEEPKDIPENFFWATKEEIVDFSKQGLVSEHIMQCLGASVLNSK